MNFLFKTAKKSTKKASTPASDDDEPPRRLSRSPEKKEKADRPERSEKSEKSSSARSSPHKHRDENQRPASVFTRSSRSTTKAASQPQRHTYDANSHPLNLPPEQLRRLSALSSMSDPMPMDLDQDATPSSPPQQAAPATLPDEATNGSKGAANGDEGPAPPPHGEASTTPQSGPTPEEAEAFKTAGNDFYKAREYRKAIDEYTKGLSPGLGAGVTFAANC